MLRRVGISALCACVSKQVAFQRSHALRAAQRTGVMIGNPANGVMDPIHVDWTDIVGLDCVPNTRLAAGPLLIMLDMCAARASQRAADHVGYLTQKNYLTCTVNVTNTLFATPVLNGDTIRMDGRVVHCGASSMGIYIRFYRSSATSRVETPAGESFFTMVTITPDLKAAKIVPAMELTDPLDIAMSERYKVIRRVTSENAAETAAMEKQILTREAVCSPANTKKTDLLTIPETNCYANRIFFSAHLNNNNTIFGGELMAWMEQHAVHCGRLFTGNRNIFTIGMHSVTFPEPVYATDWVTLGASVIYVRNSTMEVDVTLRAERRGGNGIITNRASFVLINVNDIGQKMNIPHGLDLSKATQKELHLYLSARARYKRSKQNKYRPSEELKLK